MSTQTLSIGSIPQAARSPLDPVLLEWLRDDPLALVLACHPPDDWVAELGRERVRACPIAEEALVGMGIGAAAAGLHPLVDVVRSAFIFVAMEQIVNQAAKLRYLSGGQYRLPLTIKALTRLNHHTAGQHEQTSYGFFLGVPGLKVVVPGTAEDAPGLLRSSLAEPNPVLFFESFDLAPTSGPTPERVPIGAARVVREGEDVTIVAIGSMMTAALEGAARLEEAGVSCEVVDPRSLAPLDAGTIRASVQRTGRLVVVDEMPAPANAVAAVVTAVVEDAATFRRLRAHPRCVMSGPAPLPFNEHLERSLLPSAESIAAAAREVVAAREVAP